MWQDELGACVSLENRRSRGGVMRTSLRVAKLMRALCASGCCALIFTASIGSVVTATVAPVLAQTQQNPGVPKQTGDNKQNQAAAEPGANPATPPKVCKECQYLADDIAFIQGRIDQLLRSEASFRQHANLQDPNVQRSLKEGPPNLAYWQALLAQQQAKLAKCVEDKCKAKPTPPPSANAVPATPQTTPATPSTNTVPVTPQTTPTTPVSPPSSTGDNTLPWQPWIYRPGPTPTKYRGYGGSKPKPVEYVKVCSLYGDGFYYVPGTDTCVRLLQWQGWRTSYNIDQPNWGGSSCGFGCGGGPFYVRPFNFLQPPLQQPSQSQSSTPSTWRAFESDLKYSPGIDYRLNWNMHYRLEDDLLKIRNDRESFKSEYKALPDSAKSYFDPLSTLGVFDKEQTAIRGRLQDFEPPVDTAAAASTAPASDAPTAPASNTSDSVSNPAAGGTPVTPSAAGDSTPASPAGGAQTTTGDSSGTGSLYVTMIAKILHSTVFGKVGDPEPGALVSLNGPKYPLRKQGDTSAGPQDGADKSRPFCITITDGTCEFVIEISDKNYYGLGRVDLPRIYLNLETANYRGGFNVVGKDPPSKIDTATEDGNTVDLPSSFNIGSTMVARHIFRTPDDGSDGYPKRIKFTIDPCLFILPAPWGAELQIAKDLHSELPSATLQLSAPDRGGVQ
jgi:porin-like protein